MRRFSALLILSTTVFQLFAQGSSDVQAQSVVINLGVVLLFVAMAAHILYTTFFSGDFRTDYTVAEFEALRKEAGQSALTKQEVEELDKQLDSIDNIWGEVVDTAGDTVCYPHKYTSVKESVAVVTKVVAANPANNLLVEKINTTNELLNHSLSRQFNGSKAMVIIAVVLAVVLGIFTDNLLVLTTAVLSVVLYVFASRTPNFMLISQLAKGRESLKSPVSRVLSSLFMGVATAKTYKREVVKSDGTKTTKTDRSERWISLVIAIVGTLFLTLLLPLIAAVNYVRNYLIYR